MSSGGSKRGGRGGGAKGKQPERAKPNTRANTKRQPRPTSALTNVEQAAPVPFSVTAASADIAGGPSLPSHWTANIDWVHARNFDDSAGPDNIATCIRSVQTAIQGGLAQGASVQDLIVRLTAAGPLVKFIVRIDVMALNAKKALKVVRLLLGYKGVDAFNADFDSVWAEAQTNVDAPTGLFGRLCAVDRSERILHGMQVAFQDRVRKVAKVPDDIKRLVSSADALSKAVKEYVAADDATIAKLQAALRELNEKKLARQREVEPVRAALVAFNAARSGVLTDAERITAVNTFGATENLRNNLTQEAYLRVLSAKKAAAAINSGMQSFRVVGDAGVVAGFRTGTPTVRDDGVNVIWNLANELAEGVAHQPDVATYTPGSPTPGMEVDDLDLEIGL